MPLLNDLKKPVNYSKNANNLEIQKIYNSKMWKTLRLWYLKKHPLCEIDKELNNKMVAAVEVHHKYEISAGIDYQQKLNIALNINNLMSICLACHHEIHNMK